MRVVALKAWSNGSISMEERQIAELSDALATSLIAQGIVAPTALPEITGADDGKVLTADSGVWVAANPIGGRFVVTFTQDPDTEEWSADKTLAECVAAWNAGQTLVAYDGKAEAYVPLGLVLVGENREPYEFNFIVYYYDGIMVRTMVISTDTVDVIDENLAPAE